MRIRYKDYIEDRFLIDEPKTGQLVPFKLNKVQAKYYQQLCDEYDIEGKGITATIRDIILKARREGFSSFVLALFAADDILQPNPSETLVISYKDDATDVFRKRYRTYVLSAAARKGGYTVEQIQKNIGILDEVAKQVLTIDANDIELKHNHAHFYCGTASARTGGRGGVLQKVLFSEEAHYPDTEKMTAREIVDGTLRQVDINSGWAFRETTANGYGNYYEQTWAAAVAGESRFKPRFYGWREFYTEDEFKLIASEFTDKRMLKQEYPETPDEAFIASGTSYFDNELIMEYIKKAPPPQFVGEIKPYEPTNVSWEPEFVAYNSKMSVEKRLECVRVWQLPKRGGSYVIGGDVAEGIEGGDYSTLDVTDNQTGATVAAFKGAIPPDEYILIAYALGVWYNNAYMAIEVNKDGLWVNKELYNLDYPNMYFREQLDSAGNTVSSGKLGFRTGERERPHILSELRRTLATEPDIWTNESMLRECLTFVRNKVGRPDHMPGKNDDEIFAKAIALEVRRNMPASLQVPADPPPPAEDLVRAQLERLYGKKEEVAIFNDFVT